MYLTLIEKHSPIRIKKRLQHKVKPENKLPEFNQIECFSRNVSYNTKDENKSNSKSAKKGQFSKLYIHTKKKKKLRFTKKKK